MRSSKRSAVMVVMVLTWALTPVTQAWAAGPFDTFARSANMTPIGSSLRPATSSYNSDLAFWGTKAYQGTYEGFRILDISNPASPTPIGGATCAGSQGDVIVWNNILVRSWNSKATANTAAPGPMTCDGQPVVPGFEGLHVFDVSNPADPALVASVALPCGSHTATGVPDAANGRLVVYNSASDSTCPWNEIVTVPFATPAAAALAGLHPTGRGCHDTNVILGSAMYVVCAGGNGFTVSSIGGTRGGTLLAPVELYRKTVAGVSIGHTAAFSWDGQTLIFGHEPGGGAQARCQASDPAVNKSLFFYKAVDGTALGTWTLPRAQTAAENCTIHNFNVVPTTDGSDIVVSGNYQSGISVVDFTDPAKATEIAYADPAPLSNTLTLGGDWSSYWYDGHIYQSDITRGLLVWDLDDPRVNTAKTLGHLNPQTQETTY
jgi:hypothetical protein